MAKLGHWGFTIQVVPRSNGDKHNVLIWAGAGMEVVSMQKIEQDLDRLVELMEEKNTFKHFSEVWQ